VRPQLQRRSGVATAIIIGTNQAGNGLVSVGGSLSDLPTIARRTQTLAQYGVSGGITCAVTNVFCLHGQRHIAISSASAREGLRVRRGV
jgi:hypothetical protein